MFKKVILMAGICALGNVYNAQAMLPAMWTGFKWGATLPGLVGATYVVTANQGSAQEKLLPALIAVGIGGGIGAIGGALSYACTKVDLNQKLYRTLLLSRARLVGGIGGTFVACAFVSLWGVSKLKPF